MAYYSPDQKPLSAYHRCTGDPRTCSGCQPLDLPDPTATGLGSSRLERYGVPLVAALSSVIAAAAIIGSFIEARDIGPSAGHDRSTQELVDENYQDPLDGIAGSGSSDNTAQANTASAR